MSRRIMTILAVWMAIAGFVLGPAGMAQTTTARISGVLTDETGGALPGGQVAVLNVVTGVQRSTVTDASGRFVMPELVPGPYQLTVTMTGFNTLVRSGITLTVGQDARLNLSLKVGGVTEQVTITGEAPLVDTSSSTVSGVVEQARIQELPLNGRDFAQLALIEPGVTLSRNTDTTAQKYFGNCNLV